MSYPFVSVFVHVMRFSVSKLLGIDKNETGMNPRTFRPSYDIWFPRSRVGRKFFGVLRIALPTEILER